MIMIDSCNGKWIRKHFLAPFAKKLLLSLHEGLSVANRPFLTPSNFCVLLFLTFISMAWSSSVLVLNQETAMW